MKRAPFYEVAPTPTEVRAAWSKARPDSLHYQRRLTFSQRAFLQGVVQEFLRWVDTLDWSAEVANRHGALRADLERHGIGIGMLDQMIAAHALALETDAPDISPSWLHPDMNSPEQLPRIAAVLAELRGQTEAAIAQQTSANVARVLPRLGSLMMA